jgi:hypothetical protein
MHKFNEFTEILSEGRSRGESMEEVIISAVNGKPVGNAKHDIDKEAGVKVAAFLKKNGVRGKGVVLGADNYPVSAEWASFWPGKVPGSTKTPKTDFMVGKARISLKTGSQAQLMSGGRNESTATFNAALNATKSSIAPKVVKKIEGMLEGLAPASVAKGGLKQEIAKGKDKMVMAADKAHKEMMKELGNLFSTNKEFANAFAFEAMSGDVKFNDSKAACTHFLVTDWDGDNCSYHKVTDKSYVSNIARKMDLSVRFKTTSVKKKVDGKETKTGEYRYWSVVGLIVGKLTEEFDALENNPNLNEGMISNAFDKLKSWLKGILSKITDYMLQSTAHFMKFMAIQPVVSVVTNIAF